MPDPLKPRCTIVPGSARYANKAVRCLRYDDEDLVVEIQGDGFSFARVVFRHPAGFRVLDERDLSEFWTNYAEPNGWLWEVLAGGWMDLERHRPSFNSHEFLAPLREFLVVDERCISVLCAHPPEITDVGANRERS